MAALLALRGGLAQAAEAGAAIPFKQEGAGAGVALQGGALGVLLLSALAIVVVWWLRKRLNLHPALPGGPARLLRVLETQRLGPRALLSVIEFEGRRYLIAQSEQGVSCLVAAPEASTVPPTSPPLPQREEPRL